MTSTMRHRGPYDAGYHVAEVEQLLRRRGSYRSSKLLLTVLMLEVWLATYLPRATAVRPTTKRAA
jgi:hypothetical protein